MSLADHEDKSLEPIANDCRVRIRNKITSPFAWAISRANWEILSPYWNAKEHYPMGWDFSLTYFMRMRGMLAVSCVHSRCQNIGREGGVHETPETFDKTQLGLTYSEMDDCPDIDVAWAPVDIGAYRKQVDQWMVAEMEGQG